jgi:hypothetical protein
MADPSLGLIVFLSARTDRLLIIRFPALLHGLLGLVDLVAGLSREISPRDEFTNLFFLRALVSVVVAGHFGSIGERVSVASALVLASSS